MATPVNIDILKITDSDLPRLGQVKELQIFGSGSNFHPDGLFSVQIFGSVGTEYRNRTFGYIDLHYPIFHPVVYRAIVASKSLYKQIIDGAVTAVWDPKTKTFEKSTAPEASTGFTFFASHIHELKFENTDSDRRTFNIQLIQQTIQQNKHFARYLLVMPAGLRDYTINTSGKPEEDEVNALYRRLISQSQLVDPIIAKKTPDIYDNVYANIQSTLDELYEYISSLLEGKNKLILGKWLSRKIFNSTRNVITASTDTTVDINDVNRLRSNDVGVGMYQFLRAAAPKTLYEIRNKYLKDIFVENNNFAHLTNVKTWHKEEVLNTHVQKDYDLWTTTDGLENVIASFANLDIRHLPVLLNRGKHCLGLLYNDTKTVKFFQDIRELPKHLDKKFVSPITMAEFLYLSIHHLSGKIPAFATRYPINGYGGIYPAFMKLRTTSKYEQVRELDNNWTTTEELLPAFPVRGVEFVNGMIVHQSHMKLLGGDFDGDTMSLTAVLTDEAIADVTKLLNSKKYYLNSENKIIFSNSADILDIVLSYMTS